MADVSSSRAPPGSALGLGLLSAAALAFEIALTRLFALQQFYHFAFMVVSLAVLGSAASGALLAWKPAHPPLALLAAGFALSVLVAYATLNGLPFDSYAIAWDRRQVVILAVYFLAAGLPFLLSGWVAAACLADAGLRAHRAYAANLGGAALGCPLALVAIDGVGAEGVVPLTVALALLAAAIFARKPRARLPLVALAVVSLVVVFHPPPPLSLHLSPYKPLSSALQAPDARLTVRRWSAGSRLDIVESGSIHVLPGLSLNNPTPLPEEAGLFLDGEGPYPIMALSPEDPRAASLALGSPTSLPYLLRPGARALILRPGAGLDATLALAAGARSVTLAFDEPMMPQILIGPYGGFSHGLLSNPAVSFTDRGPRAALRTLDGPYEVIEFALSDPFRPVASGAFSLTEDYGLTVEAFRDALSHLSPDGLLVITRWLGTPPSEPARAWATLLAALDAASTDDKAPRLIAFRTMRTATMIASASPFTSDDLTATRVFLEANAFDPIYLPDLRPEELNRHNRLPSDTVHALFSALLDAPATAIRENDFNLNPPSDDRPFFFHFFRWRQVPQVMAALGQTSLPFGGSGYLVLLALLALMLMLAIPLALAPLAFRAPRDRRSHRAAALAFFACLGAGYMFVEIPIIQRASLVLDRPASALAMVLCVLLLASGIGSLLANRLPLVPVLAGAATLLVALAIALPWVAPIVLSWSLPARLAILGLLLSPPSLLMGVPFATGLRLVGSDQVPWAWAINGAASGVAGVLAALAALDLGFSVTLALGALAYLGALLAARGLPS
jgi:hypothetical protein